MNDHRFFETSPSLYKGFLYMRTYQSTPFFFLIEEEGRVWTVWIW